MVAPIRTWKQVVAQVRAHRAHGPDFRWLELDLPLGFSAPVAGQFVPLLLDFPSPVLLPRPMSVASVTKRGARLSVGFLYAPVGAGTRALAQLAEGDTLTFNWKTATQNGRGVLRASRDGARVEGTWGYGDRPAGGGQWTGTRAR
jgi:NAD(P)H-flavin reductase